MREIKFRAWDSKRKEMLFQEDSESAFWLDISLRKIKGCISQYTGLKDKNGIEIYEGDIVKVEGKGLGIGYVEYYESYFRIFRPYVFSVNLCNHTKTNDLEERNTVEVIGNIHENTELLK